MSIEVSSLDLAPPFIALQSAHVLESLLEYPIALLFFYLLYRVLTSRIPRLRSWYDRVKQRFGRLFLLIVNLLIVSPLLIASVQAGIDAGLNGASAVLSDVAGLMGTLGSLLLFYVIWLSFGPRQTIISQIQERKLIPIVLDPGHGAQWELLRGRAPGHPAQPEAGRLRGPLRCGRQRPHAAGE
ncbi:MAG: hypothetical protein K0Q89_1583 [Thermomicrobiales bacterium]|nr:hypothetical protein [Thermomicrobiales bacterium]